MRSSFSKGLSKNVMMGSSSTDIVAAAAAAVDAGAMGGKGNVMECVQAFSQYFQN